MCACVRVKQERRRMRDTHTHIGRRRERDTHTFTHREGGKETHIHREGERDVESVSEYVTRTQ
jgi:hypothetical protein